MAGPVSIHKSGVIAARYAFAVARAKGDPVGAVAVAEGAGWHHDTPAVLLALKAAVAASDSTDATSAGPLLPPAVAFDFCELMRPMGVVGRMAGFMRVPFRTRLLLAANAQSAQWTGEGTPLPVGKMDFDTGSTIASARVGGIAVQTVELVRSSAPNATTIIGTDLARACAQAVDEAFLDPTNSGTPGIKPASVFDNVTEVPSSGSDIASVDQDLRDALAALGDSDLANSYWVMRPSTAAYLGTLRGSGGAAAYAGMSARGGALLGVPVIVTSALPDFGSPQEGYIGLVDAAGVALADDNEAAISFSEHAALEMQDAPSGGAQALVSLWQNSLVALRAERIINWVRRRGDAATFISGVKF